MPFLIQIKGTALKDLRRINTQDRERLASAIDKLEENPYVGAALKGALTGLRRIRVGNYRVVYEIQEQELIVLVVRVAHRGDAYR